MTSYCTIVTSGQHFYQTIVQFDKTIVFPRKLATGSIHDFEVLRILKVVFATVMLLENDCWIYVTFLIKLHARLSCLTGWSMIWSHIYLYWSHIYLYWSHIYTRWLSKGENIWFPRQGGQKDYIYKKLFLTLNPPPPTKMFLCFWIHTKNSWFLSEQEN